MKIAAFRLSNTFPYGARVCQDYTGQVVRVETLKDRFGIAVKFLYIDSCFVAVAGF